MFTPFFFFDKFDDFGLYIARCAVVPALGGECADRPSPGCGRYRSGLSFFLPRQHCAVADARARDANGASHTALAEIYRIPAPTNRRANAGFAEVQLNAWRDFDCIAKSESHLYPFIYCLLLNFIGRFLINVVILLHIVYFLCKLSDADELPQTDKGKANACGDERNELNRCSRRNV